MDLDLMAVLRDRPLKLGVADSWDGRIGFLLGYNNALSGAPLDGFAQFLCMRTGGSPSLTWISLIRVAVGESPMEAATLGVAPSGPEERYVDTLFELLDEFATLKRSRDGRATLWEAWGRHRSGGRAEAWIGDRRDGGCMTVDQASDAMGVDRRDVLGLARSFRPHPTLPVPVKIGRLRIAGIADGRVMVRADDVYACANEATRAEEDPAS